MSLYFPQLRLAFSVSQIVSTRKASGKETILKNPSEICRGVRIFKSNCKLDFAHHLKVKTNIFGNHNDLSLRDHFSSVCYCSNKSSSKTKSHLNFIRRKEGYVLPALAYNVRQARL